MGTYRKFHFNIRLKKDIPNDVFALLQHVNDNRISEIPQSWVEHFQHPFFALENWSSIFCEHYNHELPKFIEAPTLQNTNYHVLLLSGEIKSGRSAVIEEFVSWITPYIIGRKKKQYIGYTRWDYAEREQPNENIYVERTFVKDRKEFYPGIYHQMKDLEKRDHPVTLTEIEDALKAIFKGKDWTRKIDFDSLVLSGYAYRIGSNEPSEPEKRASVAYTGRGGVLVYVKMCRDNGMPDELIADTIFIDYRVGENRMSLNLNQIKTIDKNNDKSNTNKEVS